MSNSVIGKIYSTNDYSKFRKLNANRDVKNVKKIIDSINEVGYVLSPILVNENFEVIDGQNRLDALKALGLPVPYIVQEGIGIEECRHLNIGQSNWTTLDFIKSYAASGNIDYIRLLSLIEDYLKHFSIEGILYIAIPSSIQRLGGSNYKFLKSGEFQFSEEDYETTKRKLDSMIRLGFIDFKEKYNMRARTYWPAVSYAYVHEEVDPAELIKQLNRDPMSVVSCSKLPDQLSYFDQAYNWHKKPNYRVFMSTDFQMSKYLTQEVSA